MSQPNDFPATYDGVLQLLQRLLAPDGCPWDREQTHESMKPMLLEECYELIEAIEQNDVGQMVEELGDVLFHVMFQMQIGQESGRFTSRDVFGALIQKLVRRHPHVFADTEVSGSGDVVANWDDIKRQEKAGTDASILDGVPKVMPSLAYAQSIQGRAARAGFDWDDYKGVLDKVVEELQELEDAQSDAEREQELGDLLFSMVNAARWLGLDAESALRHSNAKFYQRFAMMERTSRERSIVFADLSMVEKEALWQEAKEHERRGG